VSSISELKCDIIVDFNGFCQISQRRWGALTGLEALGSVNVFWRKRQTISKLSFDGYWKTDGLFVKEHVETKDTSYCVRIEYITQLRIEDIEDITHT